MENREAILVVSFGTAHPGQGLRELEAVENAVAKAFPACRVERAFTSAVVRRHLAQKNIPVDSMEEALERLKGEGAKRVWLLPAYLFPGGEYRHLLDRAKAYRPDFQMLAVARPLLDTAEDMDGAVEALRRQYPVKEEEALLLVGHGTAKEGEKMYPALREALARLGEENLFAGVLVGGPAPEEVAKTIREQGYTAVRLVPLMLTSGKHLRQDIAGEQADSWVSRLRQAGLEVRCVMDGLAGSDWVRGRYLTNLRVCMEKETQEAPVGRFLPEGEPSSCGWKKGVLECGRQTIPQFDFGGNHG